MRTGAWLSFCWALPRLAALALCVEQSLEQVKWGSVAGQARRGIHARARCDARARVTTPIRDSCRGNATCREPLWPPRDGGTSPSPRGPRGGQHEEREGPHRARTTRASGAPGARSRRDPITAPASRLLRLWHEVAQLRTLISGLRARGVRASSCFFAWQGLCLEETRVLRSSAFGSHEPRSCGVCERQLS
jgi:hypothetical protein